jgi:hypothetical protein
MNKAVRLTIAFVALFIGVLLILSAASAAECLNTDTTIENNIASASEEKVAIFFKKLDAAQTAKFFEIAQKYDINIAAVDPIPNTMVVFLDQGSIPVLARLVAFGKDGCVLGGIHRLMSPVLYAMAEVLGVKKFEEIGFTLVKPGSVI